MSGGNGHDPDPLQDLIAKGHVHDLDALVAAADIVGRSGAADMEIGLWEDEDRPWYAYARYTADGPLGADGLIFSDGHPDPVAAVESLARRLLTAAVCTRCRGQVTVDDDHGGGFCRWTRQGRSWVGGCEDYQ